MGSGDRLWLFLQIRGFHTFPVANRREAKSFRSGGDTSKVSGSNSLFDKGASQTFWVNKSLRSM